MGNKEHIHWNTIIAFSILIAFLLFAIICNNHYYDKHIKNLNERIEYLEKPWEYREYKDSVDFWYDNGTGITLEEFESCEPITCECAKNTQTPCALFCVRCKEDS